MDEDLRAAEQAAGGSAPSQTGGDLASVRENEEQARGLYTGASSVSAGSEKKGRFKGVFKKNGPAFAIIFMVFGFGGMMGATQLFQPFSLLAQFTETYNTMHTSANFRTRTFLRLQLGRNFKNPVKGSRIFGTQHFKISDTQAARLRAQDIEYDADAGTLTFTKITQRATGETVETRVITAGEFESVYRSDPDFFNAYNRGSMTWRGAIANWFGTMTEMFLRGNKITRNLFDNFQKKVEESDSGSTRLTALTMMDEGTNELGGGGIKNKELSKEWRQDEIDDPPTKIMPDGSESWMYDQEGDEKSLTDWIKCIFGWCNMGAKTTPGEELKDAEDTNFSKFNRSDLESEEDVRAKLEEMGEKANSGGSITAVASKIANYTCLGFNFLGGISLLVSASEAMQIKDLVAGYFENIDKVKAGYGNDTAIHDLANALNEEKTSSYDILNNNGEGTTTQTIKGTAMSSGGIVALYSGSSINASDPSVQSFNFTKSLKRVLNGIGVSMAAFQGCSIAKIAANGVSALEGLATGASVVGCIAGIVGTVFTFGMSASACGPLVAQIGIGIGVSIAASVTISMIIGIVSPVVAKMLTRNLIMDIGGVDLGNALMSGANMYQGNNHRANGGSLATLDKYKQFAVAQQEVIAENAKYERQTRDPFDITSKYTFMGTLLTQMMSFLSANSLTKFISSTGSVVSSSIAKMSPTAMAYDITNDLPSSMEEYEDTCPYLAGIDAIGDDYCNPYSITDISTMEATPQEVIDIVDAGGNFLDDEPEGEGDGNVRIDPNSDLAKYILYCDNRASAFGIADQNIISQVSDWGQVNTENSTFNSVVNSAIGAIPVVGDIIDVVDNSQALANTGYISGASCVAGNTVDNHLESEPDIASASNWETAKWYQRFIEDQSLAESMGLVEESAVTAFLKDYYEENPLDNSYEGILARYSGMTKDNVIALLDIVEYGSYIANYDASERYAFEGVKIEESQEILFDNDNRLANFYFIMPREISFSDVRNRSFAV